MSDVWSSDKLLLFIGFVIPGFISLKTYEMIFPGAPRESSKQLVDAVAYSCINYALLFLPIYAVETNDVKHSWPTLYLLFYATVLLVAPVAWVLVLGKLRQTQFFQSSLPHPTGKPWDFVFGQRRSHWVIVTLRDKTRIAGKYASGSFASSAPDPEQIYMEEAWVLNQDGGFDRPRTDSDGIMVLATDIVSIEFFKLTYGGKDGKQDTAATTSTPERGVSARPEGMAASTSNEQPAA